VIKNACLTSNSPLALIPAYAYCYLLSKWVDPKESFSRLSATNQLSHLIEKVVKFEKKIMKFDYFKGYKSHFTNTSQILIKIYNYLLGAKKSNPEKVIQNINSMILDYAKSCTQKKVYSVNDV
jgi:hypothetical protein